VTNQERFETKFSPEPNSGCWLWVGCVFSKTGGYGAFKADGKMWRAHRFAWVLYRGLIPDGLMVLHHCDNRGCVNPEHLWLGTTDDNMADMVSKGRASRGAKHARRLQPEHWEHLKGDGHWTRLHPERVLRGERQGRAKLTEEKVREIRGLAGKVSQDELADQFGVCQSVVSGIILRRTWREVV
jgi:hypothetical protein